MSRLLLVALTLLVLCALPAWAGDYELVVESAQIKPTKANGKAWDASGGLPDPYVIAALLAANGKDRVATGRTAVQKDTLQPRWQERVLSVSVGDVVALEVWDKDVARDDPIGSEQLTITKKHVEQGTVRLSFGQVDELRLVLRAPTEAVASPAKPPEEGLKTRAIRKARQAVSGMRSRLDAAYRGLTNVRQALGDLKSRAGMTSAQRKRLDELERLSEETDALHQQGRLREAVQLSQQVVTILKELLGENHPLYATGLNNLAVLYDAMGDYGKAEPLFRQALAIDRQALGEKHPGYAKDLNNLAGLYESKGDYGKAEPLYREALAIYKQTVGEKHPDYAQSLSNLAGLYDSMGEYAKAEPLCRQALAIKKQVFGEKHPDYALSLNNLASLYESMGDYGKAEPLFRQALAIYKQALGEGHPDYARILNNLAALYDSMGDYARAEPLYRQTLAIRKRALGEKHPTYAGSLNNLAMLYESMGDHDKAEPLLRQALAIYKPALGEGHPAYATSLNNLAGVYDSMKDYARAEPLYRQALAIRKRVLGEKHPAYATSLNNLAELYHSMGDYVRAELLYRQTLAIFKDVLGDRHPLYAIGLSNLALLYWEQGDPARAERLLRPSLEIRRENLDLAAVTQSERQQLAMTAQLQFVLNAYLSLAAQARQPGQAAYAHVLAWKGAVLARQRRLRLQRRLPELAADFAKLERVSSRLANLALAVPDPSQQAAYRRQVEELSEGKERLEADLARKSAAFGQERQTERLSPDRLQASLPTDAVLVDFLEYTHRSPSEKQKGQWHFERRLAAFVVRRDSLEQLDLGPLLPISQAIDRWRGSTKRARPVMGEDDPALELRRRLWRPLQRHLRGARLVLVSPDGALARLPLGVLPGSDPEKYLLEEVPLAIVPVPQLLPELLAADKAAATAEPSLLLIGDVDFGAAARLADARGASRAAARGSRTLMRFPGLDATREEMLAVADSFRRGHRSHKVLLTELREEEATEAAVRRLAPGHRYLHFATHGFFAPPELRSALAPPPARDKGAGKADLFGRQGVSGFHPGLLSGLALAGANRPGSTDGDDGILTALEVAEMDLSQVELATLSACETGLGESAGGEGLLGLQRAFQVAGARSVVASLWKVDDEATRKLMARFYESLWRSKDPLSKLEALRQAQLWMLREGIKRGLAPLPDEEVREKEARTPPYYWAAFVLSGDWR